ncbi:MAG: SDR family oxidoreductase [Halieaceae bacterium]|nr:SDR family oxidoreductase [Halieaceae bacterium]
MSQRPVAFITGASRGIGAATARALATAGYDLAITARSLEEGEQHEHGSWQSNTQPLAGSLTTTARQVEAEGGQCLCLRSDILEPASVLAAVEAAQNHQQRLLDVTPEQVSAIYQGNVLTPLATVQAVLPGMLARGEGTILNMVSGSAVNPPPAPADQGGWGFAYPSSKAALLRMVLSLRVEHAGSGLRFFNVEPGFVYTEVMRANNFGEEQAQRFNPTDPAEVAAIVCWLVSSDDALAYADKDLIFAPQLHQRLWGEKPL